MTTASPNFGALLLPVLAQVDSEARPRFLALLERTAAQRYRDWAEQLPEHRELLIGCANREDEIADRIEAAFELTDAKLDRLRSLVPQARDIYYGVFDGMPVLDQLRLQADAELQGANAWRSIAQGVTDPHTLEELATCSALEEHSSREVRKIL